MKGRTGHFIAGQIVNSIAPECKAGTTFCEGECDAGGIPGFGGSFIMQQYRNSRVDQPPLILAHILVQIRQGRTHENLQRRYGGITCAAQIARIKMKIFI